MVCRVRNKDLRVCSLYTCVLAFLGHGTVTLVSLVLGSWSPISGGLWLPRKSLQRFSTAVTRVGKAVLGAESVEDTHPLLMVETPRSLA